MSTVSINLELGHICRLKKHIYESIGVNGEGGYTPGPGEVTHDWQFFIRDRENEEMTYVDKIVVYLHETFPNSVRTLYHPPFRIKEQGYAGFEIVVNIYFKGLPDSDSARKAVLRYDLFLMPSVQDVSNRKEASRENRLQRIERITITHRDKNFIRSIEDGKNKSFKPNLCNSISTANSKENGCKTEHRHSSSKSSNSVANNINESSAAATPTSVKSSHSKHSSSHHTSSKHSHSKHHSSKSSRGEDTARGVSGGSTGATGTSPVNSNNVKIKSHSESKHLPSDTSDHSSSKKSTSSKSLHKSNSHRNITCSTIPDLANPSKSSHSIGTKVVNGSAASVVKSGVTPPLLYVDNSDNVINDHSSSNNRKRKGEGGGNTFTNLFGEPIKKPSSKGSSPSNHSNPSSIHSKPHKPSTPSVEEKPLNGVVTESKKHTLSTNNGQQNVPCQKCGKLYKSSSFSNGSSSSTTKQRCETCIHREYKKRKERHRSKELDELDSKISNKKLKKLISSANVIDDGVKDHSSNVSNTSEKRSDLTENVPTTTAAHKSKTIKNDSKLNTSGREVVSNCTDEQHSNSLSKYQKSSSESHSVTREHVSNTKLLSTEKSTISTSNNKFSLSNFISSSSSSKSKSKSSISPKTNLDIQPSTSSKDRKNKDCKKERQIKEKNGVVETGHLSQKSSSTPSQQAPPLSSNAPGLVLKLKTSPASCVTKYGLDDDDVSSRREPPKERNIMENKVDSSSKEGGKKIHKSVSDDSSVVSSDSSSSSTDLDSSESDGSSSTIETETKHRHVSIEKSKRSNKKGKKIAKSRTKDSHGDDRKHKKKKHHSSKNESFKKTEQMKSVPVKLESSRINSDSNNDSMLDQTPIINKVKKKSGKSKHREKDSDSRRHESSKKNEKSEKMERHEESPSAETMTEMRRVVEKPSSPPKVTNFTVSSSSSSSEGEEEGSKDVIPEQHLVNNSVNDDTEAVVEESISDKTVELATRQDESNIFVEEKSMFKEENGENHLLLNDGLLHGEVVHGGSTSIILNDIPQKPISPIQMGDFADSCHDVSSLSQNETTHTLNGRPIIESFPTNNTHLPSSSSSSHVTDPLHEGASSHQSRFEVSDHQQQTQTTLEQDETNVEKPPQQVGNGNEDPQYVQESHQEFIDASELTSDYLKLLRSIQARIANPLDTDNLDSVVGVIEKTGCFAISSNSFNFDLCLLDKQTVFEIQRCLNIDPV